jgi:hypothetical protein
MAVVPKTKENLNRCICLNCPSYALGCQLKSVPEITQEVKDTLDSDMYKVDHLEAMFCAFGKSKCIDEKKGCLCGGCPNMEEYKPGPGYFCKT